MQVETTATEESLAPGSVSILRYGLENGNVKTERPCRREPKILRRPGTWCKLTDGMVGLLRMTATG